MCLFNLLRARFAGFAQREDGNIAIEACIILPALFWAYLSMFSIFDSFRQYSLDQKVAYTIGDMVSRETDPIDNSYMTGAHALYDYLVRSTDKSSLRITSVRYDAVYDIYKRDWSEARGTKVPLTNNDVKNWHDRLPVMPHNERIMIVETWRDYTAPFDIGLAKREIHNFVFTRPRYAPRVLWDGGSEGA